MIRWKKMRREPLPNGTILSFLNGEEFGLQALLAENKNALFYEVRSQTTGQAVVLKEFFNSHWVRLRGAPALKGWEQEPPDSRKLSRTYLWLRRQAEQEQRMNQELCGSVRCVIPEKPVLPAGTLVLPDGTEWQWPYCAFLEMDGMTAAQGFPMQALMRECTNPNGPAHPFGNLRQQEECFVPRRNCAVPAAAVTMQIFRDTLLALRPLHRAGWIMGDLSSGNLFVEGSLAEGRIQGVSFADVSTVRKIGGSEMPATAAPGFHAPELFSGPVTEKTDVFSAGRLLLSMLYPVAVHNVRLHRPLGFLDNTQTITAGESVPSGLPQEMRAEVNRLLLRATAPDPEQRISMDEMLATAEDWCRRLER